MAEERKNDLSPPDSGNKEAAGNNESNVSEIEKVDLSKEKEYKIFDYVPFSERASLEIARWILLILGIVYLFCFFYGFYMLGFTDVTFDNGLELVKYLLSSILPLATLAVGFYLGDRNKSRDE